MNCELCKIKIAEHQHHKFPQYKSHKKLYPDFIHLSDNIIFYCGDCHLSKSVETWSELEFCRHFKIKPRSKELLFKIAAGKIENFWSDKE